MLSSVTEAQIFFCASHALVLGDNYWKRKKRDGKIHRAPTAQPGSQYSRCIWRDIYFLALLSPRLFLRAPQSNIKQTFGPLTKTKYRTTYSFCVSFFRTFTPPSESTVSCFTHHCHNNQ